MSRKYSAASKFRKPLSLDGLFYSHGLMCASYPRTVIALVATVVVICSLPFFITSSGDLNKPMYWRSPWLNYRVPVSPHGQTSTMGEDLQWIIDKYSQSSRRTPSWFVGLPVAVVQQLYAHVEINCEQMKELCDKPYHSISKLVAAHMLSKMEHSVSNCHSVIHPAALNLTQTLSLHAPATPHHAPRPPTGVLSPMLDDSIRIKMDDIPLEVHSIKELMYGGFWEHERFPTVVPPHPSRDSPPLSASSPLSPSTGRGYKQHRVALSLLLRAGRGEEFQELVRCVEALKDIWPDMSEKRGSLRFMKHFFYEPELSLLDFAPLLGVYGIVFLYISFSVGKIDLVKSKIGLGVTACLTVVAGLTMSLGICTFFGLSISLSGSEIYPYIVIVMGLENILIIVKAVMSTPEELEVKYRIAVGLSKEGWAITRNLFTLVIMTSMGIVFFNYVLKEFCIIALVGLLCDAFMQLVFFLTVLSIDLRRLELSDLSSAPVPVPDTTDKADSHSSSQCRPRCPSSLQVATPMRWRSKRVKFIYFLARTRIVSRLLMLSFVVLVCALVVQTGTFHSLLDHLNPDSPLHSAEDTLDSTATESHQVPLEPPTRGRSTHTPTAQEGGDNSGVHWAEFLSRLNQNNISISRRMEDGFQLKCGYNREVCWRPMVTTHWPRLLNHTGYSTEGKFLTLLPPIFVDFFLGFNPASPPVSTAPHPYLRFLYHPLIVRLTSILGFLVFISCYVFGLVRSSLFRHERYMQSVRVRGYNRIVCLKGHSQDVDYLCVDSGLVVTTSLDGDIRVWDANPMKRRCARVIARSELCREPPAEVSSSSHRPAAEGCEATSASSPTALKHTGSASVFSLSRRGSTTSYLSRSSSVSDYYDHHGNRTGPQSASRLSSVSDVSSWDQLESTIPTKDSETTAHIELISRHKSIPYRNTPTPPSPVQATVPIRKFSSPTSDTPTPPSPVQATVPIRRFSSQTSDTNLTIYTSPQAGAMIKSNSLPSKGRAVVPPSRAESFPSNVVPLNQVGVATNGDGVRTGHMHTNAAATSSGGMHAAYSSQLSVADRSSAMHAAASLSYTGPYPSQATPAAVWPSGPHPSGTHPSQVTPHSSPHSHGHAMKLNGSRHCSDSTSLSYTPHSPLHATPTSQNTPHHSPPMPKSTSSWQHQQNQSTHSAFREESNCVQVGVQLEPELSSSQPYRTRATVEHQIYQQPVQSTSNQIPALQSSIGSNVGPVSHSHSSISTRSNLPNLRISHCQTSSLAYTSAAIPVQSSSAHKLPPTGRSQIPNIKVDSAAPTSSTISHMRRLGHVRHSSLGQNSPRQRHRPTHSRNRSLGSINLTHAQPMSTLNSTQGSCSNLSLMSNASICGSDVSTGSKFLQASQLTRIPDPNNGYDFTQHFNLFSQYTSNMALEYCVSGRGSEERGPTVPPVWCMGFWNRVVAVGCSNGQVEAWDANTGSLVFSLNIGSAGISSIDMNSTGIITGQMDGTLSMIGYNGLLYHCVPAHDKAISVIKWYGNKIISGSYDSSVKVHRTSTTMSCLVCVNSVYVHDGNISAVAVVESQLKLGCVSGCSKGLVIHWDINSGNCINEFGMYKSPVLQLEPTIASVLGLFGEGCVRVWDVVSGALAHTIALDGVSHDLAVLSSQHIAVSLESSIELYDLENGKPHSEKQLETERGVSLVRHIQALDGASVVCSSGKDVYIIPCDLKLKTD